MGLNGILQAQILNLTLPKPPPRVINANEIKSILYLGTNMSAMVESRIDDGPHTIDTFI
jgi:hypothetical protein